MLVTFHSKAWSSITLFGDVAVALLKLAGHSGTVPSALLARDIPAALQKLQQGLAVAERVEKNRPPAEPAAEEAGAEAPVGIRQRAYPLIQLLTAAVEQDCDVMWEEGAPVM